MNSHNKYALLIGINYFGSECELGGCHSDIRDMNAYLLNIGFKPENITIMLDKPSKPLQNSPSACELSFTMDDSHIPTRDNIIFHMNDIVRKCAPEDKGYIHYSGHGSNRIDKSGDEVDGMDECICPVDYETSGMLYDDEMRVLLVDNLPKGVKLRVVFDACHSGSALDLPLIYGRSLHGESLFGKKLADIRNENKDIIFISGCKDEQTSADSQFEHANGALTYYFIKSLLKIQRVSNETKNKTCNYSYKDLIDIMRLSLKASGYDQIPQLSMTEKSQLQAIVDLI